MQNPSPQPEFAPSSINTHSEISQYINLYQNMFWASLFFATSLFFLNRAPASAKSNRFNGYRDRRNNLVVRPTKNADVSQILFQNNHIERVIGRNQAAGTGCSPLACLRSSSRLILSSSVNASAHRMLETKIRDVLASRILETARETDGSNDAKAGSEDV